MLFDDKKLSHKYFYHILGILATSNSYLPHQFIHRSVSKHQFLTQLLPIGLIDCTRKIYQQHGFFGLFKGFKATFIRDVFGFTAFFGIFEQFSRWMSNEGPPYRDITAVGHLVAGMVLFVNLCSVLANPLTL